MRELIHKMFCAVGIHRWTEWEEFPKGRAPLSPEADSFTKLMYWSDYRYRHLRCCVLCNHKQDKAYPVDPAMYR